MHQAANDVRIELLRSVVAEEDPTNERVQPPHGDDVGLFVQCGDQMSHVLRLEHGFQWVRHYLVSSKLREDPSSPVYTNPWSALSSNRELEILAQDRFEVNYAGMCPLYRYNTFVCSKTSILS